MNDNDWIYHLTRKSIALIIKNVGMTSALTRIGRPVVHPLGSTAQNRKKQEDEKNQQKLKSYLCMFLARGCTEEQIKQAGGPYTAFTLGIEGSNEADVPRLNALEEKALEQFAESFPDIVPIDKEKFSKIPFKKRKPINEKMRQYRKDPKVKAMAFDMLISNRNHFLVRLAVQYVSFSYKIEETIAASHIYFMKPEYAQVMFHDYTKHLNTTNSIAVLRVNKRDVFGLEQEDSEERGLMTKYSVTPDRLEVMKNPAQFIDLEERCKTANWQPLSAFI